MRGNGRVFKRGDILWVAYYRGGKEIRESSNSTKESDARKLLRQRLGECQAEHFIGPEQRRIPFSVLLDAVVTDYKINARRSNIDYKLKNVRAVFGLDRALDVTATRIEKYKLARLEEGAANATINRELSAIRRAFRLAVKRRLISVAPVVELLKEDNARQGFVERADFEAIVAHLPDVLADLAWFAYLTSWRRREISSLTWPDVDMEGRAVRLRPQNAKTGEGRFVSLEGELWEAIKRRWAARAFRTELDGSAQLVPHVFHRKGKPVRRFEDAWTTACEKAGQPSLLFHDLRRSGVRNMVRAGVPERVAMAISGHKTRSVFDRYNITSEKDIREAGVKLQAFMLAQSSDPKVAKLKRGDGA